MSAAHGLASRTAHHPTGSSTSLDREREAWCWGASAEELLGHDAQRPGHEGRDEPLVAVPEIPVLVLDEEHRMVVQVVDHCAVQPTIALAHCRHTLRVLIAWHRRDVAEEEEVGE